MRFLTYSKGFIPLFILLLLFACEKKDQTIGLSLLNDNGEIGDSTLNIEQVICRTIAEDSLRTDSLNANVLGAMNDPEFGISRANFIWQPRLPETGQDFSGATVDSVVVVLKYRLTQNVDGDRILAYGDLESNMTVDVFKVAEDLNASRYFSNSQISIGDQVGSYSGKFNFFDSVTVVKDGDTSKIGPQLRFKLDNSFGTELLSQPASTFASNTAFLEYLKGLAFIPDANLAVNEGAFVGIDFASSTNKVTVHYNGGESMSFGTTEQSRHIGTYDIISQPATITSQINGSGHFATTYVQSLGGTKIKVDIPEIDALIEKGEPIAILQARIGFPILSGSATANQPVPYRALLFRPDPVTGENSVILDFVDDIAGPVSWRDYTNYGGTYDPDYNGYIFRFNRYLQDLINTYIETGENKFEGFYFLLPSDFPITPSRAIINSEFSGGVEVSISYNKLN